MANILALDPKPNFAAVNGDLARRIDRYPDLIPAYLHDTDRDVLSYEDGFSDLARQNEHLCLQALVKIRRAVGS